eukprot:g15402.t1
MLRSFPTGSWHEQPITQLIQRMAVAPDLTTHTDTNTILRLAQVLAIICEEKPGMMTGAIYKQCKPHVPQMRTPTKSTPSSQPGCAHEFLTHILLQLTEGIPTSQPSTDTKGLPVPGTTERLSESDTKERLHPSIQMRTMTDINCHRRTNGKNTTRHIPILPGMARLHPDFLNIEVNRIAYDGERRVTSTAGQSINNNLLLVDLNHLDLSAYFSPIYTINREAIYTPISFLLHKGPTVNDGHWMAVIRDPHHGCRLHDDSRCLILDHWRDQDLTAVFKRVNLPEDPPNSALQTVPTELLHLNIYETITAVLYQRVDLGAETPTGHSAQPLPSHSPFFLPTIPRHSHIPEAPQAYP